MEKHVYFVRHGQSESNADGIYRGKEAMLTEDGREQARAVAHRIERIGVDALLSSTFPRAVDTAGIIGERIGITPMPNELFGEWVESTHIIGVHRDDPIAKEWKLKVASSVDDPEYRHGTEETFAELFARTRAAIGLLEEHPAERICVVTHGGFLKMLIGVMVFGDEFTKAAFHHMVRNMPTTNTGVTYVRWAEPFPRWQLVTWNDQSHLG